MIGHNDRGVEAESQLAQRLQDFLRSLNLG